MDIHLQKLSRKDAIEKYFYDGYSYLEIIKLFFQNIMTSPFHLDSYTES